MYMYMYIYIYIYIYSCVPAAANCTHCNCVHALLFAPKRGCAAACPLCQGYVCIYIYMYVYIYIYIYIYNASFNHV